MSRDPQFGKSVLTDPPDMGDADLGYTGQVGGADAAPQPHGWDDSEGGRAPRGNVLRPFAIAPGKPVPRTLTREKRQYLAGTMSLDDMAAYINRGRSVVFRGRLIAHLDELPTLEELADVSPQAALQSARSLEAQIASLEHQRGTVDAHLLQLKAHQARQQGGTPPLGRAFQDSLRTPATRAPGDVQGPTADQVRAAAPEAPPERPPGDPDNVLDPGNYDRPADQGDPAPGLEGAEETGAGPTPPPEGGRRRRS